MFVCKCYATPQIIDDRNYDNFEKKTHPNTLICQTIPIITLICCKDESSELWHAIGSSDLFPLG